MASSLGEAVQLDVIVSDFLLGELSSSGCGVGKSVSQHIKQNSSSMFFSRSSDNFWSDLACLACCFVTRRTTVHLRAAFRNIAIARAEALEYLSGLNRAIKWNVS